MSTGGRTGGGGQSRAGKWLEKELPSGGRLPRKRELALALRALLRLLKSEKSAESADIIPSQAEVAERLGKKPTSLSRFASLDPRVPDRHFIATLHAAACTDAAASGQVVGITLEALQTLRINAEAERQGTCRNCVELGERLDSLTQQPCPACMANQREQAAREQRQAEDAACIAHLRSDMAAMRARMQEMETTEAGLQARLAMLQTAKAPLPVPRRQEDRQRSKKERAAARQLAAQAAELDRAGNEGFAFTILRQGTTELLSPPETALVVVELRQQKRDHLADDLIHVYGRDQKDRDVMTVAAELHAEGAIDDAGAILRAALR